jgi:DNA modification methylase
MSGYGQVQALMARFIDPTKTRFIRVASLPRDPRRGSRYWLQHANGLTDYTHYLFRYPAKFHRPVVQWALASQSKKTDLILDPFCGSGTLNVEALVQHRSSIGIDVDPLASFIARVKTTPIDPERLDRRLEAIEDRSLPYLRSQSELERLIGTDISEDRFERESRPLVIPAIPNINHWFRRHVIIDLARLRETLLEMKLHPEERDFFMACFASTIRRVSNADPTPVSGLEVTTVQAKLNKKREINVREEYLRKCRFAIHGMRELWSASEKSKKRSSALILCGDARDMEPLLAKATSDRLPLSLIVTSPPYCNAVEYGRRHKLEMFWLDLVETQSEHQTIARSYIGNNHTGSRQCKAPRKFGIRSLDRLLSSLSDIDTQRALSLERYFASMQKFFYEAALITHKNASLICFIGDSTCAGREVRTSDFIPELAKEHFVLRSRFSYAIQNHYMQYGLRNGKGIREEVVLQFKRM